MAYRIVVNVQTGEVTQVEYTAEEQAVYDSALAAETSIEPVIETSSEPVEPTQEV